MANKGLRRGTKQLETKIGNVATSYVNLNNNDANLIINIPLITLSDPTPLELSLIFNYQTKDTNEPFFGYGFRLNLYASITTSGSGYLVTTADGASYQYNYTDSGYLNNETRNHISRYSRYGVYYYRITDSKGNYIEYREGYNYPSMIHYENGKEIEFDFYSSNKHISSTGLFTLTFSDSSNLITGFTYTNDTSLGTTSVTIGYSSNRINYISVNGLYPNKKQILFTLETNKVKVQDNMLYVGGFFDITNGKVSKVTEQYYNSGVDSIETTIAYDSKKTVVTDYLGNSVSYFFDNDDLLTYELSNKNNAISYKYNSNKLLTYESSLLELKNVTGTNILGVRNLDYFSRNGISYSTYYESDGILSDEYVSSISGTGTLNKTVTINGITGENYICYMLVKVNASTSYLTLSLNGSSNSTSIRKLSSDGEYELIAVGIHLYTSTTSLTISISTSTSGLYIGGIELLKKDFGTYYDYSSDNDLVTVVDSHGATTYNYSSHKVIGVTNPDNTTISYEYNPTNKKVSKITTSEGCITEYTYTFDTYNETSKCIHNTANTKKIYTRKEYMCDDKLLYKNYNELDYPIYYSYGSYGVTIVNTYDDILRTTTYETSGTYEGFPKKLTVSKSSLSSYVEFTYDSKYNVSKAKSKNLSEVEFSRNNLNDKTTTTLNNLSFSKYEYNSNYQISKIKSAPISDGFSIYYSGNNVTNIKYSNSNNVESDRYSFTYNSHDDLTKVTYHQSSAPYSYKAITYNENKNISQISGTNFNNQYKYSDDGNLAFKSICVSNNTKLVSYGALTNAISTKYYTNNNLYGYDLYPLNGNVCDINTIDRPIYFNKTSGYKPFVYESGIGSLVLNTYYVDLAFSKGYTGSGTIVANIYVIGTGKQYIFYNEDDDNHYVALYIYNNTLYVEVNGNYQSTNLTVSLNTWYKVGLTFNETITGNSGSSGYKYVKVYLNSYTYETSFSSSSFSDITTYIGKTSGGNYRFDGYMANLAFKDAWDSEIQDILSATDNITISKEIDEIGLFTYKRIKPKSTSPYANYISHHYYPKCRQNDNTYKSHLIARETISTGVTSFDRYYTYDNHDLVTAISNSSNLFGNHSYEYDYRGFLTSETFNGQTKSYTYDDNGNILTAGNTSFSYDSTIKDRLISVGGSIISYSSNNSLNPSSFDGWSYRYEGRRLVEAEKDNSYEDIKITFTYDEEGNITRRDYYYYSYEDEYEETSYTLYYYESGKLVTEITPSVRNDYLYDSEGNLIGFIVNNSTKYFYITDILSNIIGIVDESGNIVTRYYTDAYGYNMIISGNTSIYNPFRYKGYYWDSDIEMYWCKSRFYVPYWRRWLNADSIEYLDINNVGCVNLFAYCNNNPVMFIDPEGTDFIGLLISLGISVAFSMGGAVIKDWKDNGDIDGSIGFEGYMGAFVNGFISGLGSGVLSTIATSMLGNVAEHIISNKGEIQWKEMVLTTMFAGAISGIAYGVGQTIRYGFAGSQAKHFKNIASKKGNAFVNKIFKSKGIKVNIGTKNINKIANALFDTASNRMAEFVELASSNLICEIGVLF